MSEPNWSIIASENPGLTVDHVSTLGEGWGSRTFLVNHEMVFKFPKRADDWQHHAKEFAILRFVEPKLPLTVPEPRFHRQSSNGWLHGYTVYSLVPGQPIDKIGMSDTQLAGAAHTLASFLQVLHALKLGDPDIDFSDFFLELGADFVLACARAYRHPAPDAQVNKLWQRSLFVYLYDIIYSAKFGLPGEDDWAWAGMLSRIGSIVIQNS